MSQSLKKKIRFGLLQYPITSNFFLNRSKAFRLLNKLASHKPDYIVLPEMWLGGPLKANEIKSWADHYQNTWGQVISWCQSHQIGLFFSQLQKKAHHYFNTAYYINKKGLIKGEYQKIHLFGMGGEKKIYSPGKRIVSFNSEFGKIGYVICYDIRFPELIRRMTLQGIQCLIVSAQWPSTRSRHWLTLLEARAIENQIYVIAVNRLGKKEDLHFNGQSVIINPWGERLLHLPASKNIGFAECDMAEVARIRKAYPFLKDFSDELLTYKPLKMDI